MARLRGDALAPLAANALNLLLYLSMKIETKVQLFDSGRSGGAKLLFGGNLEYGIAAFGSFGHCRPTDRDCNICSRPTTAIE
jgi:hypothetical protein